MSTDKENNDVAEVPIPGDIGWHDYVIGLLTEEEIFNGRPTVDGLRRVAQKILGISSIRSRVIETPSQLTPKDTHNDKRATVQVTIILDTEQSFDGIADSYWNNTDQGFRNYVTALAETRAEGRALKRALLLRKIITAEEAVDQVEQDEKPTTVVETEDGFITDIQIQFLSIMCGPKRLNINVLKLLKMEGMNYNNIKALTHQNALTLQERLSAYEQDRDAIPTELIGYDLNWTN